jgi:hypothetical protein
VEGDTCLNNFSALFIPLDLKMHLIYLDVLIFIDKQKNEVQSIKSSAAYHKLSMMLWWLRLKVVCYGFVVSSRRFDALNFII